MSADRPLDFGSKLREARERRGVTLRQIANATKISVSVLEGLERNDISRLPGGIFGRAFVRSYAVEVGLDPETIIQDFIAQFPHDSVTQGHPTSEQNEDNETVESDRRMAGTFLSLIGISIPIAAAAVLYFGMTASRRAATEPLHPAAASAPAAHDKPATEPSPAPPPAAEPTSSASAPARSAPAAATTTPASPPAAATPAPDSDVLTIALSARRPCWVSATVDGQKKIERLMPAGDQQTVEVRREIVLTAGDASAIALTLNGADARPLGRSGDVVTVRINPTNFRDYLQAR